MSNLNKDYELEIFIKDKLLDELPNQENVFILYIKAITSSLTKLYSKFKNIDYSIACSESVHSIFWIILNYSNNLKLTMFLCDRAIVLFMEYIELSVNINENLNLLEIKLFIYKKSIGPLVLNTNNINNRDLEKLCLLYKHFIYNCLVIDINYLTHVDELNSTYISIVYKLFIANQLNFLENTITLKNPTIYSLNKLYFRLTLYHHLIFNIKNITKIKNIYNTIITDTLAKDVNNLKELKFNIYTQDFYSRALELFNTLNTF